MTTPGAASDHNIFTVTTYPFSCCTVEILSLNQFPLFVRMAAPFLSLNDQRWMVVSNRFELFCFIYFVVMEASYRYILTGQMLNDETELRSGCLCKCFDNKVALHWFFGSTQEGSFITHVISHTKHTWPWILLTLLSPLQNFCSENP